MVLPDALRASYFRQKYRFAGRHSAVKLCHWLRRSLNTGGAEQCYKNRFFGVPSHRCLQMTPSLGRCTQRCVFCWRATPETLGVGWEQTQPVDAPDPPSKIVDGCLEEQRGLLSGFGGNPRVDPGMLEEALNPVHAAISLEGEPTLYPLLGELVEEFLGRGFKTVFIVSNGTRPGVLSGLRREPSQLYISACAPDEETYRRTCRPMVGDGWARLLETLEYLESFSCPTVLRHTVLPKANMCNVEGYARLAELGNPTYIEVKAAMSVGSARARFGYEEMARFPEVMEFAERLAKESGYQLLDSHWPSNVVLLGRVEKPKRFY